MFSIRWISRRRSAAVGGEAGSAPAAAGAPGHSCDSGRHSAGPDDQAATDRPDTGYWGPASARPLRAATGTGMHPVWSYRLAPGAMEGDDPGPVHTDMARVDADMAALDAAVDTVLIFLDGRLVSRHVLINPLLNVWEAARVIDSSVTRPVERLLTRMVSREMVPSDEVTGVVDDVRARAIAASVVSNCVSASGR